KVLLCPCNLPGIARNLRQVLSGNQQLLAQIPTILAERDQLLKALGENACLRVWPSDSNFLYARLSDRGLAVLDVTQQSDGLATMFKVLRSKGTLIRHTGGGLRISIGTSDENQRTLNNLSNVLESKA
ncbi:MAG: histidinol-phosphate aminotransferase, partial [Cyanobacteria bacterium P01_F01_bin.53]